MNSSFVPQPRFSRGGVFAVVGVLALLGTTTLLSPSFGFGPGGLADRRVALSGRTAKPSATVAVVQREAPFRSAGMSVTIAPGEGTEVLTSMTEGDSFVFAWASTGAPVSFDMHGEMAEGKDHGEIVSYWKDRQKQDGFGSFTAPFDGTHGWYWHNPGSEPVTIHVTISGYFDELVHADGDDSPNDVPFEIECCYPPATPRPETT